MQASLDDAMLERLSGRSSIRFLETIATVLLLCLGVMAQVEDDAIFSILGPIS
jgi:hypothetical protein